jgi:co-chaperonin GroES (HSP10)
MHIRLLHNRILVQRAEPPKKEGSIWIPESVRAELKDKVVEGTVIAVGPGRYKTNSHHERHPMLVKPGDRVFFHPRSGDEGAAKNAETGEVEKFFFLWPDEIIAMHEDGEAELMRAFQNARPEDIKEIAQAIGAIS